jgi:hypothetical protein
MFGRRSSKYRARTVYEQGTSMTIASFADAEQLRSVPA